MVKSAMAAKHSRHIALTALLMKHVEDQVAQGRYASVSEMVRAALRLLKERDDALNFQNLSLSQAAGEAGRLSGEI